MTIKTEMQTIFESLHASLVRVEFQKKWSNGTGYFDNAIGADIGVGIRAVAWTAPAPDSRRGIIVRLSAGDVVLFERYTPDGTSPFVLVGNVEDDIRQWWPRGQWSTEALKCLTMMVHAGY